MFKKIKQFLFGIVSFLILIPVRGLANAQSIQLEYGVMQPLYGVEIPQPLYGQFAPVKPSLWSYLLYIALPIVIVVTIIIGAIVLIKKKRRK
jgi:hypothetical protein